MNTNNLNDGLFAIAKALDSIARALNALGKNEAATPMGAIELLAKEVRDGMRNIAETIGTPTE